MSVAVDLRLRAALATAAIAALAACSEQPSFDPVALNRSADSLMQVMQNSTVLQSLDVMGDKMSAGAPALALAQAAARLPATGAGAPGVAAWGARQLEAFQRALPELAAGSAAGVIPDLVKGKTFQYNPATGRYEPGTQPGAPSNGVRFILYAVNPVTRTVVEPLNPVGYLDLMDESTATSTVLHLKAYVTGNSQALVDYTASASLQGTPPNVTGFTLATKGYLSDGTNRLDLDLTQAFSVTAGASVTYRLSLAEKGIGLDFQATFTPAGQATVKLTVTSGGNTTVISASGTQNSMTGQITYNGKVVVNIAGNPSAPTFTDASGGQLTQDQVTALKALFDFVDRLLAGLDALMKPAHNLLGITIAFQP